MNSLFKFDKSFSSGCMLIGTDEAGRGPGAGGVFAAAVCFKPCAYKCEELIGLNDSKKLTVKKREELYEIIKEHSFCSVKMSDIEKIEELDILGASLYTMRLAVHELLKELKGTEEAAAEALVLVDGNRKIFKLKHEQKTIVKGDSSSAVIAAASILAKVERDKYMSELHEEFPMYNWAQNKGYLTKEHVGAIKKYGPCKMHRPSFLKKILKDAETVQLSLI